MLVTDPALFFSGAQRVLFVHAHPDDETISTGGTIAALNSVGRTAAVLTLTRGEHGEASRDEFRHLEPDNAFAEHRSRELDQALTALSVSHHAFLGSGEARAAGLDDRRYEDSGMSWGTDGTAMAAENVSSRALTRASIAEALGDLIAFAAAIGADALVSYDEQGGYGHPDHVLAHQLTRAAAVGLELPFWVIVEQRESARLPPSIREGLTIHEIGPWMPNKRRALAAHASQLTLADDHFVLSGGQVRDLIAHESFARLPQ